METILAPSSNDAAFYRKRKAMLMYPVIVLPFIAVLFWLFDGGKGEKNALEAAEENQGVIQGFNAVVPNAKGGSIDDPEMENPGYGQAQLGQVLSDFTDTRRDSSLRGLNDIQPDRPGLSSTGPLMQSQPYNPPRRTSRSEYRPNPAAVVAVGGSKAAKDYYYNPPSAGSGTSAQEEQFEQQLRQYQENRKSPAQMSVANQAVHPVGEALYERVTEKQGEATVRMSDKLKTSRLAEGGETASPFNTAPTGGSRPRPTRSILSSDSQGSRKTITWMVPVTVHGDQAVREGEQVKLRLLKEVSVEGLTIPENTILYATSRLANERLQLHVGSLQLGGRLIPLDLDVYDADGAEGINVPGLSRAMGGQVKSSAVQGIQVPGIGGLGNSALNAVRMNAAGNLRQSVVRIQAGYTLFLKAQ